MARLLVVVLCVALFAAGALAFDSVSAITARDGFYRQFTLAASPSVANIANNTATALAVLAVGAQASGSAGSGSAQVDIAGFKFKNPADTSDSTKALAFYFGYLGVSGVWDSKTATASLSGAAAEILTSFDQVYIYYENDGVPGLTWNMYKDVTDCAKGATEKFDCVDLNGTIAIANISWGPIIVTKIDCPSGYNVNCSIYKMETASTDGSLTFTMRLASEPVFINGVKIEPNFAKVDVKIVYPWASRTLRDASKAKIALTAYSAGKAGTASASYSKVEGNDAVTFELNGKSAYFSWDKTATLTSGSATVYYQGISGSTIKGNSCTLAQCGLSLAAIVGLKWGVGVWEFFGWKVEMHIFSWDAAQPQSLYWDPALGLTPAASSNPAIMAVPSLLLSVVAIFAILAKKYLA